MEQHAARKKSILLKTLEVGMVTFASRILGLIRETVNARFLGATALADAFETAFMIPNSLRKIFAEGALTAAFLPTFLSVEKKEGRRAADKLTTLCFVVFECFLLIVCALVMWHAEWTIKFVAPGYSVAQQATAVPMLRILMPFIFFISTSALLAGALSAAHHFFVPSFAPVLLNIVFIGAVLACLTYGYDVEFLCWAILGSGALQCLMHLVVYWRLGFGFAKWDADTIKYFVKIILKFFLCFISMSVMELSLFIDSRFASHLAEGSVSIIKKATRLMGIPLGVFATAFSTILLPHFTRVRSEDPERLNMYLMESIKFVLWVTIPATFIICFLSDQIFLTLFVSPSSKFPVDRVSEAGLILVGYMFGLCCFSLNRIFLSLYYAFHDTLIPMIISVVATLVNIAGNYYFVDIWGGYGLALATSLSGCVQTILSLYFLGFYHAFSIDYREIARFTVMYLLQVAAVLIPLWALYERIFCEILQTSYGAIFTTQIWFWVWAGPLILVAYGLLYLMRNRAGTSMYFLN